MQSDQISETPTRRRGRPPKPDNPPTPTPDTSFQMQYQLWFNSLSKFQLPQIVVPITHADAFEITRYYTQLHYSVSTLQILFPQYAFWQLYYFCAQLQPYTDESCATLNDLANAAASIVS
jgi:hypothetical protein